MDIRKSEFYCKHLIPLAQLNNWLIIFIQIAVHFCSTLLQYTFGVNEFRYFCSSI